MPDILPIVKKRETFQSPYTDGKKYVGKKFVVLKTPPDKQMNNPDFIEIYEIKFETGEIFTALPEEIFTGIGWESYEKAT